MIGPQADRTTRGTRSRYLLLAARGPSRDRRSTDARSAWGRARWSPRTRPTTAAGTAGSARGPAGWRIAAGAKARCGRALIPAYDPAHGCHGGPARAGSF